MLFLILTLIDCARQSDYLEKISLEDFEMNYQPKLDEMIQITGFVGEINRNEINVDDVIKQSGNMSR